MNFEPKLLARKEEWVINTLGQDNGIIVGGNLGIGLHLAVRNSIKMKYQL